MTLLPPGVKVHLAYGYTDMHKRMDGPALLVQEVLQQDPFCGHLFVFRGRKANLIKVVFWDGPVPVHETAGAWGLPLAVEYRAGANAGAHLDAALGPARGDRLALSRASMEARRRGVTLANWVGGASWWLEVLRERLAAHLFASGKLFADDTPIPVLDPGRGRMWTGRLWVYVRDDRPWGGPDPPAAAYFYSPDRRAERPAAHLGRFRGILQVDGYAGFETLAGGEIMLAACWAHARRTFYDVHQATGSPIAAEALRRIAELYAIETVIRTRGADERQRVRSARARPLVDAFKPWLEDQLQRVPLRGGLAGAIRYVLAR